MTEVGVIALLFVLSLAANALITRWSTKRVLGLDVSMVKAGLIVTVRSLAALLAGFSIGYGINIGLIHNPEGQGQDARYAQMGAMALVACLSFLAYWAMLGKLTNSRISFWGMTKTVATETTLLVASVVGVSVVLSTVFYFFS